jgi:hypothetical protein
VVATAATEVDSYADLVRARSERFAGYLRRVLGTQAECRGGRIGVEDTLQDAFLRIHARWPELAALRQDERDRCLYRCVRDAAVEALRREHGRRDRGGARRPRTLAFDFNSLHACGDEPSARGRELATAVLGTMVRDLADADDGRDVHATLDRGVLLRALRALTEKEAVVLIAADHLGMAFGTLRPILFDARKIFYSLVRHLSHCERCQAWQRRLQQQAPACSGSRGLSRS